jgi:putative transposase
MKSIGMEFSWSTGGFFRSRYNLGLEILALRQQLDVLKRKTPRPGLRRQDRVFWVLLRRIWPLWSNALIVVKPETVVAWHRAGFRLPRHFSISGERIQG